MSECLSNKQAIGVLCIIGAVVVASSGHDGWGWLLFLAFMVLT